VSPSTGAGRTAKPTPGTKLPPSSTSSPDALAENAARSLTKGDRVTIDGRLDQRSWETDNGERRSKLIVPADDISTSLRWAAVTITKADRHTNDTDDEPYVDYARSEKDF